MGFYEKIAFKQESSDSKLLNLLKIELNLGSLGLKVIIKGVFLLADFGVDFSKFFLGIVLISSIIFRICFSL